MFYHTTHLTPSYSYDHHVVPTQQDPITRPETTPMEHTTPINDYGDMNTINTPGSEDSLWMAIQNDHTNIDCIRDTNSTSSHGN